MATELSLAFSGKVSLTDLEVDETIRLALESEGRSADTGSVLAALDRLYDLGYIWSEGSEARLSFGPGIPSLMRYVAGSRGVSLDL